MITSESDPVAAAAAVAAMDAVTALKKISAENESTKLGAQQVSPPVPPPQPTARQQF